MYVNKHQYGFFRLSLLLTIAVISCIVMLIMKLGPVYLGNYLIQQILASLVQEGKMLKQDSSDPQHELYNMLEKRLDINEISRITVKNINITNEANGFAVRVKYDAQVHLVGNIDALIHFDDATQVPLQ